MYPQSSKVWFIIEKAWIPWEYAYCFLWFYIGITPKPLKTHRCLGLMSIFLFTWCRTDLRHEYDESALGNSNVQLELRAMGLTSAEAYCRALVYQMLTRALLANHQYLIGFIGLFHFSAKMVIVNDFFF